MGALMRCHPRPDSASHQPLMRSVLHLYTTHRTISSEFITRGEMSLFWHHVPPPPPENLASQRYLQTWRDCKFLIAENLLQSFAGVELMRCCPECVCVCVCARACACVHSAMFVCLSWWWWCYSMFFGERLYILLTGRLTCSWSRWCRCEHEHCSALGWDRNPLLPSFPRLSFSVSHTLLLCVSLSPLHFFYLFLLFLHKTGPWGNKREMLDAALLKGTKSNIYLVNYGLPSVMKVGFF